MSGAASYLPVRAPSWRAGATVTVRAYAWFSAGEPCRSRRIKATWVPGRAERELVGETAWQADGLVFNSEEGAPLHRNPVAYRFKGHLKDAGLGAYRLHDLRHTYGSLLMSQGVPLKTISDLMGHASIDVTADIYLHSLDVQVRDTARSVKAALAAPRGTGGAMCHACGQPLPAGALGQPSTAP